MEMFCRMRSIFFVLLAILGLHAPFLFAAKTAVPATVPATAIAAPAASAPTPATATPSSAPIGQVVWVKGAVKAITTGKPRDLQRRSPIYLNDTIQTDKTSTGQIVFTDNSLIALAAGTTIHIDAYQFGKNVPAGQSKFVASIVEGGFRTVTGLIPKENADNYQINTPVATIGVRGTSYAIVYKGQLFIKYYSGTPCVSNKKGTFCLSEENPFAGVAGQNAPPIRLAQDPGVFKSQPDVVPASFTTGPLPPSGAGGGGIGPGGSAVGPGGTITPKNNSFCIQ